MVESLWSALPITEKAKYERKAEQNMQNMQNVRSMQEAQNMQIGSMCSQRGAKVEERGKKETGTTNLQMPPLTPATPPASPETPPSHSPESAAENSLGVIGDFEAYCIFYTELRQVRVGWMEGSLVGNFGS